MIRAFAAVSGVTRGSTFHRHQQQPHRPLLASLSADTSSSDSNLRHFASFCVHDQSSAESSTRGDIVLLERWQLLLAAPAICSWLRTIAMMT